jgi:hypothetical protein
MSIINFQSFKGIKSNPIMQIILKHLFCAQKLFVDPSNQKFIIIPMNNQKIIPNIRGLI